MASRTPARPKAFDAQHYLETSGAAREVADYGRAETVFAQGETGDSIFYIQQGGVKLSVASTLGREVVTGVLGPGDFCGEGGLAGQSIRTATATAIVPTTALVIGKQEMLRVLHAEQELSERFLAYMLSRNIRIEEDLVGHLFNSIEKRLARALLILARYGTADIPTPVLPRMSQARLARMTGTTRARVRGYLAKFARLGFIEDAEAGIRINSSLLNVVLHD
jgi:CRP/FNR family cyclic AMP-dependent transcriptional regulator